MKTKKFELTEKSKLYLKHSEIIIDLLDSFERDSSNIFKHLTSIIQSVFQNDNEDWKFNFKEDRGYQQVFKAVWDSKKDLRIHFEYCFDKKTILIGEPIILMIDVEGKRNDEFFKKFEITYKNISKTYSKNKILFRPSKRKVAIAYKEYRISQSVENLDIQSITDFFQKTYDEFEFIISEIDAIIEKIK